LAYCAHAAIRNACCFCDSSLRQRRALRRGHRGHEMLALIQNAKVTSKVKSGDTVGDTELWASEMLWDALKLEESGAASCVKRMWAAHVGSTAQPGGVSIPGLDSSDLDLANLPTSGPFLGCGNASKLI
jgi:hypothetical protein